MTDEKKNSEPLTLAKFFETVPPGVQFEVSDMARFHHNNSYALAIPDIRLHCESENCGGLRVFSSVGDSMYLSSKQWKRGFAVYSCRNCNQTLKSYALTAMMTDSPIGVVYKYGEVPGFGPPTPARVMTLIGPDREIYLQGRRAENQGLGIGAFAYYRRVVENQRGRIIGEIGRVAKRLGAPDAVLDEFVRAAKETQFSRAIETIKSGIPSALMMQSHNPLVLLHGALSDGLHEQDDVTCLELAQSIRVVLTELAERMAQVLKEEAELEQAVGKLLTRKAKKSDTTGPPDTP